MNFAPYQSSPPEHERVLSPTTSPRASADIRRTFSPGGFQSQSPYDQPYGGYQDSVSPPPLQHPQPQRQWQTSSIPGAYPAPDSHREGISEFDTSLGFRLDYEACAAYLLSPPLGAILLLILERNSDYVRFHAWQSSLMFTIILIVHVIFSWSKFLSWFFLIGDLALIAWMTMRAYNDADTLDRFELPVIGRIASNILDDE